MKGTMLLSSLVFWLIAGPVCAETIKIAGSGGMIPLVSELAQAYMKRNPADSVEVNKTSLGLYGGILAVKDNAVDIGMAAKRLNKEMKTLPVRAYEIARVAVEFGVNSVVDVSAISSRQLCDIYADKIVNWKELGGRDARIVLLSRPDSDATYLAVKDGLGCFATIKPSERTHVEVSSKEMYDGLSTIAYSIGMVDAVAIAESGGRIKPLALDGKRPTVETVKNGQWPMVKEFNLVLGKKRTPGIKRFLRFVQSPQGQKIIKKGDAVPSKFKIDF